MELIRCYLMGYAQLDEDIALLAPKKPAAGTIGGNLPRRRSPRLAMPGCGTLVKSSSAKRRRIHEAAIPRTGTFHAFPPPKHRACRTVLGSISTGNPTPLMIAEAIKHPVPPSTRRLIPHPAPAFYGPAAIFPPKSPRRGSFFTIPSHQVRKNRSSCSSYIDIRDLDRLFMDAMNREAMTASADWNVVLKTGAPEPQILPIANTSKSWSSAACLIFRWRCPPRS